MTAVAKSPLQVSFRDEPSFSTLSDGPPISASPSSNRPGPAALDLTDRHVPPPPPPPPGGAAQQRPSAAGVARPAVPAVSDASIPNGTASPRDPVRPRPGYPLDAATIQHAAAALRPTTNYKPISTHQHVSNGGLVGPSQHRVGWPQYDGSEHERSHSALGPRDPLHVDTDLWVPNVRGANIAGDLALPVYSNQRYTISTMPVGAIANPSNDHPVLYNASDTYNRATAILSDYDARFGGAGAGGGLSSSGLTSSGLTRTSSLERHQPYYNRYAPQPTQREYHHTTTYGAPQNEHYHQSVTYAGPPPTLPKPSPHVSYESHSEHHHHQPSHYRPGTYVTHKFIHEEASPRLNTALSEEQLYPGTWFPRHGRHEEIWTATYRKPDASYSDPHRVPMPPQPHFYEQPHDYHSTRIHSSHGPGDGDTDALLRSLRQPPPLPRHSLDGSMGFPRPSDRISTDGPPFIGSATITVPNIGAGLHQFDPNDINRRREMTRSLERLPHGRHHSSLDLDITDLNVNASVGRPHSRNSHYQPIRAPKPDPMRLRGAEPEFGPFISPRAKGSAPAPSDQPIHHPNTAGVEGAVDMMTIDMAKCMETGWGAGSDYNCARCGQGIGTGRPGCTALGQTYHLDCFTCHVCQTRLAGGSFYSVDGRPHCEKCYMETLEKCHVCSQPIMDRILRASGRPYHPGCFTCCHCAKCLDGVPFTVDSSNAIHCVQCFHQKYAPRCARCNMPIVPENGKDESMRVVAMDRSFHIECYRCEDCSLALNSKIEGRGCYPLDDHLLCKNCNVARINRMTRDRRH